MVSTSEDVRSFGIAATTEAPMSTLSVRITPTITAGFFEFSDAARKIREMLMVKSATVRIAPIGMRNGSQKRSFRRATSIGSPVGASAPGRSATATAVDVPAESSSATGSTSWPGAFSSAIYAFTSVSWGSKPSTPTRGTGSSVATQRKKITAIRAESSSPAPIFMISPAIS